MVRLTREVRFGIELDGTAGQDGRNGFAGRPGLSGVGVFLCLCVTVEGDPDPESGYLLNIKDVDREVRRRALPLCQEAVAQRRSDAAVLLLACVAALREAWHPVRVVSLELRVSPFLTFSWSATEPRMIRLSQKFEFSAAHRLHNPALSHEANLATFGKCNNPHGHGHNYEVQVTVGAEAGSLMPVHELEQIVEAHVIEALDHKHLNVEVPEFRELNPSVEHIARVIFRKLAGPVGRTPSKLLSVTVWETPKTWAEYAESV